MDASRRRGRRSAAPLLIAVLGLAADAGADATLVGDARTIHVRNDSCKFPCPIELTKTPIAPGASFTDSISGAPFGGWSNFQSSTFAGAELAGTGFTDSFTSLGEGRSIYDVTFALAEPHSYTLLGAIEAEGNAAARAQLTDAGTELPVFILVAGALVGGPLVQPLDESGMLDAGTYRLEVEGVVIPNLMQGGDADWGFTFALPEPAAWLQCLAGGTLLAALGRSPRRRAGVRRNRGAD